MDNAEIMKFMMSNLLYIVGGMGVLVVIMYVIIIYLYMNTSYLKKRYNQMMTGEQNGATFEQMLMDHITETRGVAEANAKLRAENQRIDALLQQAITRVGVVRFRAFQDMGSDLSYAVALLDSHNNGVVLSSIFGREDSRSYVKPIEEGHSTYTLTQEEEQALQKAMQGHS